MPKLKRALKVTKRMARERSLTKKVLDAAWATMAVQVEECVEASPAVYYWDGNRVEVIVLFCAFLVCLFGIMFDSSRFNGELAVYYSDQASSHLATATAW